MRLSLTILALQIFSDSALVVKATLLRGNEIQNKATEKHKHRKLEWMWVSTAHIIDNNDFYDYRSEQWWNDSRNTGGVTDPADFLRSTDKCYSEIDGSFSRENCPAPPDCSWSGQEGDAKLCINRAPFPDNPSKFYVLMMKCTPKYINCDKCFCGGISSDSSYDARCRFYKQNPSDDGVDVSCSDLSTVKMTTREGQKLRFSP